MGTAVTAMVVASSERQQLGAQQRHLLALIDDGVVVEMLAHFLLPLGGQRHHDEHPVSAVASDEFLDDDAGFDGF